MWNASVAEHDVQGLKPSCYQWVGRGLQGHIFTPTIIMLKTSDVQAANLAWQQCTQSHDVSKASSTPVQMETKIYHTPSDHQIWHDDLMIRAHSFPLKILPNSAGQLVKFRSSPRQNRPNSTARHGLPFMTEKWGSCSETWRPALYYRLIRTRRQQCRQRLVHIGLKLC